MIKLLFFAQLAEYAETDSIQLGYQTGLTPNKVVGSLLGTLPKAATDALTDGSTLVAVNAVMIGWNDPINDGDEVAFMPPFSGG